MRSLPLRIEFRLLPLQYLHRVKNFEKFLPFLLRYFELDNGDNFLTLPSEGSKCQVFAFLRYFQLDCESLPLSPIVNIFSKFSGKYDTDLL